MEQHGDRGEFKESDLFGTARQFAAIVAFLLFLVTPVSGIAAEANKSSEYRIGPEDVLEISVWNEENLHRTVVVLPDGHIAFPLAGDLLAAERTVPELREELTMRLRKFVHDAQVFVSVEKISGLRIYVTGEVQKPGQYLTGRYVDVLQAIALAGGLTPYAAMDEIQILRREGNRKRIYRFDYEAVRRGKGLDQNIMLRSDDVVLVP